MATYLLLSAAIHGGMLKGVDSPIHFQRPVTPQEQRQELVDDYITHHVPLAIRAQINQEKEAEPFLKDIGEIIGSLWGEYTIQRIRLVNSTAKDLADGKLDDINLAEFVLTLQVLRYNIHQLDYNDYPLEKIYDVATVLDDFSKKVKEAKDATGTSCDLDSLVRLHSMVFSKVFHTGYDPNRDSVLSALNGMSQCESGSEGYVLLEDERSGCQDVGLILFGDHIEIGIVKEMQGHSLPAQPNIAPQAYTEGKFIPKEVLAAWYLVYEGIPLEQFPQEIRKYFGDDPALDKANNIPRNSFINGNVTGEPWAAKAHITTRANKGGNQDNIQVRYWDDLFPTEVRKEDDDKHLDLERCMEASAVAYAIEKLKENKSLRILPRNITSESVIDLDDIPEASYLREMFGFGKESEEAQHIVEYIRRSRNNMKSSLLNTLARMPGAERETFEAARELMDKGISGVASRDGIFKNIQESKQPEAMIYLEQAIKEGLKQGDDRLLGSALLARINFTSQSRRRIPFQTLTPDEIRRVANFEEYMSDNSDYSLLLPGLAGTNPGNPMYRNIARHILFGEELAAETMRSLGPKITDDIQKYRSELVPQLFSKQPFSRDMLYKFTNSLAILRELDDRSSCDDLVP